MDIEALRIQLTRQVAEQAEAGIKNYIQVSGSEREKALAELVDRLTRENETLTVQRDTFYEMSKRTLRAEDENSSLKIQRLEDVVARLCETAIDNDYAWGAWADLLHDFIADIKHERADDEASDSCEK